MTRPKGFLAAATLLGALTTPGVQAGGLPFIGEVMCGGWNFAPAGWLEMNGQLLPIAENEVLFTLIGTTWGGDGQTTFALPDMRGRAFVGSGAGPGLTPRVLGELGGSEGETLSVAQLPPHSHGFRPQASLSDATATSPTGKVFANKARTTLYAPGPGTAAMQSVQTGSAGASQPVDNMQPYLSVKCVVAAFGIFPTLN